MCCCPHLERRHAGRSTLADKKVQAIACTLHLKRGRLVELETQGCRDLRNAIVECDLNVTASPFPDLLSLPIELVITASIVLKPRIGGGRYRCVRSIIHGCATRTSNYKLSKVYPGCRDRRAVLANVAGVRRGKRGAVREIRNRIPRAVVPVKDQRPGRSRLDLIQITVHYGRLPSHKSGRAATGNQRSARRVRYFEARSRPAASAFGGRVDPGHEVISEDALGECGAGCRAAGTVNHQEIGTADGRKIRRQIVALQDRVE